ncbi:DUF887 family protein [Protomyces lactucae-debilis]|uniref:DUF887 family protein n=1 Tax=Protomyces lactucae-debilis TaxID=2754530 RepID=A0A1Y2F4F9_PROLT|nr:DUF887 family protein [Protomyces lactucae-debilis]ORY77825.1 DUF887 family protein [Protomyces lactucae-debilis]
MQALFPAPPAWAVQAVQPICDLITLPMLSRHLHVVIGAAFFYHGVMKVSALISPVFSSYNKLDRRTKVNWDIHTVSFVQAIIILYYSYIVHVWDIALHQDKVDAYSPYAGDVYALACGYFLWDSYVSLKYMRWFGFGFVFHGLASLQIFSFSYRPLLQYWGPIFLAFEASTPFLNIHWYLDKVGMTGSRLQRVNGAFLLATFFLVRIVWGWYSAYNLFTMLWALYKAGRRDFQGFGIVYFVSNMSLNLLNLYWFWKMIESLKKRVKPVKKAQ